MIKLNVGCGLNYMKDYINIDFSDIGSNGKKIKVDVICNLLEGLPYEDNYVDEIYFSEVLEHFNRWNGLKVLKELYRILKPNGKITITVPPSLEQMKRLIIKMNQFKDIDIDDFFNAHTNVRYWKWHDDLAGATHESNGFDGDSHKTFYSTASLKSIVNYIGFKILNIDENRILIEATK